MARSRGRGTAAFGQAEGSPGSRPPGDAENDDQAGRLDAGAALCLPQLAYCQRSVQGVLQQLPECAHHPVKANSGATACLRKAILPCLVQVQHVATACTHHSLSHHVWVQPVSQANIVLVRDVVSRRRRMPGDAHPETLLALDMMSTLLSRLGDEAEIANAAAAEELLQARRVALGNDHPKTIDALRLYIIWLEKVCPSLLPGPDMLASTMFYHPSLHLASKHMGCKVVRST